MKRGRGCGVRWGMPYRIDRGSILVLSGMLLSKALGDAIGFVDLIGGGRGGFGKREGMALAIR